MEGPVEGQMEKAGGKDGKRLVEGLGLAQRKILNHSLGMKQGEELKWVVSEDFSRLAWMGTSLGK